MEKSLDAMQTALRVLSALTEKRRPDPADVEQLRNFAPLLADGPLDELACDVIQQALSHRAGARVAGDAILTAVQDSCCRPVRTIQLRNMAV